MQSCPWSDHVVKYSTVPRNTYKIHFYDKMTLHLYFTFDSFLKFPSKKRTSNPLWFSRLMRLAVVLLQACSSNTRREITRTNYIIHARLHYTYRIDEQEIYSEFTYGRSKNPFSRLPASYFQSERYDALRRRTFCFQTSNFKLTGKSKRRLISEV